MGTLGKLKTKLYEMEWKIWNFDSLSVEEESPFFPSKEAAWHMTIAPNGMREHNSVGYVGLYLARISRTRFSNLQVSFAIKTVDGKKYQETPYETLLCGNKCQIYGVPCFLLRAELFERKSELLPSNVLSILCTVKYSEPNEVPDAATTKCTHCKEIVDTKDILSHEKKCINQPIKCPECSEVIALKYWYAHECKTSRTRDAATTKCTHCKEIVDTKDILSHEKKCINQPIKCPECSEVIALKYWYQHECQTSRTRGEPSTSGTSSIHLDKLMHDFKELFISKEGCDVVIKVKGQEFSAHQNILKARSPVLESTFRNDMKEKATGVVEIDDCDPSYFSDFLCFLYCGDVGVVSKENVFSLFMVADKYDVQDLRAKCVGFIKENLSIDTFCDTITLALQYSETELIKLATDFFSKNAPKIIVTVKWQVFSVENPTRSNELFIKLLVPDANLSK